MTEKKGKKDLRRCKGRRSGERETIRRGKDENKEDEEKEKKRDGEREQKKKRL